MANKLKKFLKSFTLIELIIVIAIIAVLGATAFLLLSQWMSKSRDSRKIADLGTIDTAVNISFTSNDKLPTPDNMTNIMFGGSKVWELGYFGDSVVSQIGGALTKTPIDPTTKSWYRYAQWDNKKYQLGTIVENEQFSDYFSRAYANEYFTRLQGSYNQSIIVTKIGTDDVIIPAPSLIVDEFEEGTKELDEEYFWTNKNSYKLGSQQSNKLQVISLFSGDISSLDDPDTFDQFKTNFANTFSGTVYLKEITPDLNEEKIEEIVSAELKKLGTQSVMVQYLNCAATTNRQSSITSIDMEFIVPTTEHGGTFIANKTVNENNGLFKYTLQGNCNNGTLESIVLGTPILQSCDTNYEEVDGSCIETRWIGDASNGYSFMKRGQQVYPKSCNDILVSDSPNFKIVDNNAYNGTKFNNGIYWIKPDVNAAYKVYCDMTTEGGGWTWIVKKKVQRSTWNPLLVSGLPTDDNYSIFSNLGTISHNNFLLFDLGANQYKILQNTVQPSNYNTRNLNIGKDGTKNYFIGFGNPTHSQYRGLYFRVESTNGTQNSGTWCGTNSGIRGQTGGDASGCHYNSINYYRTSNVGESAIRSGSTTATLPAGKTFLILMVK